MFDTYSLIDMFGPVYGENWHEAEIVDGLTFRWTGPGQTSTLRVPTLGAQDIRVRWILAFPPEADQMTGIGASVADRQVDLRWALHGPFASLWADVRLDRPAPAVVATLTIPLLAPGARTDARTIGVAVNRVEVFALCPVSLGEQAQRQDEERAALQRRLDEQQAELVQLRSSTSWKVSAPLRWVKQELLGGR